MAFIQWAVTDVPYILFADELLVAYPNAKVVLNTRDPDKWIVSMNKTIYRLIDWRFAHLLSLIDDVRIKVLYFTPFEELFVELTAIQDGTENDRYNRATLRQGFLGHYEHIRKIVPSEKLLEFDPTEGWEPLREFLGKEVPAEPFPHINDAESLIRLMNKYYWIMAYRAGSKLLTKYLFPMAGLAAVIGAVWWVSKQSGA